MDKVSESIDRKKRNREFLVAYREHLIMLLSFSERLAGAVAFGACATPCIRRAKSNVAAFGQLVDGAGQNILSNMSDDVKIQIRISRKDQCTSRITRFLRLNRYHLILSTFPRSESPSLFAAPPWE